jgi:uncharacterized protein (TIGR00255 family)
MPDVSAVVSMTGYGRAEARGRRLLVQVEVRTLNHRFLEIGIKGPRSLALHEPELRRLIQGRVARGRLDVSVGIRWIGESPSVVRADLSLARQFVAEARALAEVLGLRNDLGVADVLRLPGVVTLEEAQEDEGETALLLKEALGRALDDLERMRQGEGVLLAADLLQHLAGLDAWAQTLDAYLPEALARARERVHARIVALLGEAPVDPARLAQEAATWAARSDVAEELTRLRAHVAQFRSLLEAGGPVGRQLDFLVQEMHREVNTLAAKADDRQVVERLLPGRTAVERLREQVQNVE